MLPDKPTLNWQVVEDQDLTLSWPPASASDSSTGPPRRSRLISIAALLSLIGLAALMTGSGFVWHAEKNLAAVEGEIENTVSAQQWARQTFNSESVRGLLDDQVSADWRRKMILRQVVTLKRDVLNSRTVEQKIQNVELHGDLALVSLLVTDTTPSGSAEPLREMRFYRQTEDGWVQTAPQASLWGPAQQMETAHFRFEYHQRDSKTVEAVADSIEVIYAELLQLAGLEARASFKKLTIRILPVDYVLIDGLYYVRFVDDTLVLPSPLILPIPSSFTEADLLRHSIAIPLTYQVLTSALKRNPPGCSWQPVVDGLGYWLYAQLPLETNDEMNTLRRHSFWPRPAPSLPHLPYCHYMYRRVRTTGRRLRIATVASVVDYAMTTYGTAVLSRLLDGMHQHGTWDDLIPAVFGVPADEFEADWQAYLYAQSNE